MHCIIALNLVCLGTYIHIAIRHSYSRLLWPPWAENGKIPTCHLQFAQIRYRKGKNAKQKRRPGSQSCPGWTT